MKDLASKTVKELRDIAKTFNIKGRWDMSKLQLILAIKEADYAGIYEDVEPISNNPSEVKTSPEGSQKVTKTTLEYLENAEPGTLVAFKRNNKDVAMSGKFVGIENSKVLVESKKGTLFKLNPENIIWVKTGTRWPKWVFALFNKEVGVDNAIS